MDPAQPNSQPLSRRQLLKQIAGVGACISFPGWVLPPLARASKEQVARWVRDPNQTEFSQSDELFLEELERANFLYFWEQTNPETGIVKDRSNVRWPDRPDKSALGSIAATGFGLTALCIGEKRGFISYSQARERALTALRFLWKKLPHQRGFFYHWADINTGQRLLHSEVSSIDTSILLCGILAAGQHFSHSEIGQLAHAIFNRVDWNWLSEDTRILPHGWTPETGFLQYRWDSYSEMMMMYLLGLGSIAHPLPTETWDAWKRTTFEYDGVRFIGSYAPLFVHQYSQAWFDFRDKRDRYADYFQNSILATDVHRRFCLSLARQFPDYTDDLWGITASDSEKGYEVWGGPPSTGPIDGTVVPSAAAGSLPFLPQAAMRVLRTIKNRYEAGTWSRYGFVDAFNPLKNWYDSDVVGIDAGITMVMAENARTAFVWDTFMKNPEAQRGMERAGFKAYQPSGTQQAGQSSSSAGPKGSSHR
ncbi:MAG: glucoamylase family protein [Candidatus Acidiferrales bacterium]